MILSRLRQCLIALYAIALVLAVLMFGAVDRMTTAILAVILNSVLFGAASVFGLPKAAKARQGMMMALFIFAVLTGWVAFQTLHLPQGWLANPAWLVVSDFPNPRTAISVTPADDWAAWLRLSLPISTFLISLILFDTDDRAIHFLRWMTFAAGVVAIASILQFSLDPQTLLFIRKRAYLDSLTGPFVNRNTAATFFALAGLMSLALTMRTASNINSVALRRAWAMNGTVPVEARRALWKMGLTGVFLAALVVAMVLTRSRAGVISGFTVMAMQLAFRIVHLSRKSAQNWSSGPRGRILALMFVLIGFVAIAQMLSGQVIYRIEIMGSRDPRFCVLPSIAAGITDTFPFGGGLASFRELFPQYRDTHCQMGFVWDKAHNVYLEGMLTLGIVFPLILVLGAGRLVSIFLHGLRHRRRYRFAAEAGLCSFALVGFHSAFDFSLQIPGFAVFYAAILALLVTLSAGRSGVPNNRNAAEQKNPVVFGARSMA